MITRVRLKNWRAYETLDVSIGEGTTFIVAANGVGKSSFIEAVRWALDPGGRPGDHVMRRRALDTTVHVELRVGTAEVVVARTLARKTALAAPTVTGRATIDGVPVSVGEALTYVANEWSADAALIHRAGFLVDKALIADKEPQLEEQLIRLYSLDNLQKAQLEIRTVVKALEDRARALKRGAKAGTAELAQATAAADLAARVADAAVALVASRRDELSTARATLESCQRAAKAARRAERWAVDMADLQAAIEAVLGPVASGADLVQLVSTAQAGAMAQMQRDIERRAALTERLTLLETSLQRLRDAEGECPVCRRALNAKSRNHAAHAHEQDIAAVTRQLAADEPDLPSSVVDDLGDLHRRLLQLGPRPPSPETPVADVEEARTAASDAERDWGNARAAAAVAASKVEDAQALVDDLARAQDGSELVAVYQQIALLEAADAALAATVNEVLETQLGPLSDEVNRRWEALFPDRPGLRLDAQGRIRRTFDDDGGDLPSTAFSSGEKVIANVLMRLTTMSATTGIPFIWIDEPLEHLDPTARSYVAETLCLLPSADGFAQILVTTYEEELARLLEEQGDHAVRLQFLEASPPR
ncbi:MAG: AAA family ATPase [Acidimicrobiales bacterium]